jgi:hypothetical protein
VLTHRGGDLQQRQQEPLADAACSVRRQHHQREFSFTVLRNIFAVANHRAGMVKRQYRHMMAIIERIDTAQQGEVRRLAVCKVTLVKACAVHCGKEALNPTTVGRARRTQTDVLHV